jgi:threonine synthase
MSRSVLTHLECPDCGASHDAGQLLNLCPCGGPLLARYDLSRSELSEIPAALPSREGNMWRYAEVMPAPTGPHTLGEGWTPLIPARATAKRLGLREVTVKDESLNPTGSFKARGLAAAVSMARTLGARALALPSAGNAGSAAAAYGALAGIPVHVFLPTETPLPFFCEVQGYGAILHQVPGHIGDAGRAMRDHPEREGWFDLSTLKEPYRLEGKKTMGYELAEQLGWRLPTVVLYPTGGGTGLIGMWKAFEEMETLGWLERGLRPRMFAVQSMGCAPVVRALEEGSDRIEPWSEPRTSASGIRVPAPFADKLILKALRDSGGGAVAVEEADIAGAARDFASREGILMSPEGAACALAMERMVEEGRIGAEDRIVLFHTGTGLKYLEALGLGR